MRCYSQQAVTSDDVFCAVDGIPKRDKPCYIRRPPYKYGRTVHLTLSDESIYHRLYKDDLRQWGAL